MSAPTAPLITGLQQPVNVFARTPKLGYLGQSAATTAVLYTAPSMTGLPTGTSPCTALVKSINVCNTDSSARTYTITVGGTSDATAIFKSVSIAANTTHHHSYPDDSFPLADGVTVNGLADSASKVTVRIGVVEITA